MKNGKRQTSAWKHSTLPLPKAQRKKRGFRSSKGGSCILKTGEAGKRSANIKGRGEGEDRSSKGRSTPRGKKKEISQQRKRKKR